MQTQKSIAKILFWLCVSLSSLKLHAQNFTISGYVEDATSSEKLIGVNIYENGKYLGTTSNVYGFYSLTLPKGEYSIVYSYVGYQQQLLNIDLKADTVIHQKLQSGTELQEVEIVASQGEPIHERTQMSSIEVPMKEFNTLPVLLGEKDVIKTLQLLPGVQSGSEGSSGMYVRGGGPDQNLILLDGVPVYNASHLFGFFSIFTPEAINNITLTKGGFPARYGGRLSSVLDIRMKDGDMSGVHGNVSTGVIATKVMLEGPIIKDKSSFVVSGRRTYIDLLSLPFQTQDRKFGYYFYDFTAKWNYKFSDKDRIFLSGYFGQDKGYTFEKESYNNGTGEVKTNYESDIKWGNVITAFRWNHIWNNKLFSNATLTYSRYKFSIEDYNEEVGAGINDKFRSEYQSNIYDWAAKMEFDYIPNTKHYIKFGGGEIYHTFTPGATTYDVNGFGGDLLADTTFGADKTFAHEMFLYVEDDMRVTSRLKMNVGLHFSAFALKDKWYTSLQPRLGLNYIVSDKFSIKAAASQMTQYLHLLTNSTIGLPTDLWVPATEKVKPQSSWQYALGGAYSFNEKFEVSLEGYYKKMDNLIEYKEGANFFNTNENWETKIESGEGEAYGMELFVQKKVGNTTGWIGYTLAWSNRTFENLNFGKTFPYRYDRRHDVSIALSHQLTDKLDIGAVWVYGTGRAVTLPTLRYSGAPTFYPNGSSPSSSGGIIEHSDDRNGFREPSYHRLDLSLNFKKKKKRGERIWTLGVYNVYSRANPFYIYFDQDGDEMKLKQVSLFPIIPSISYSYSF